MLEFMRKCHPRLELDDFMQIENKIISLVFFCNIFFIQSDLKAFVHTSGQNILDSNDVEIIFRGMALGGWLVPEGYMLQIPGWGSPTSIENNIINLIGENNTEEFYYRYRDYFVQESDIEFIASLGFNSIRLPFHYKIFSEERGTFSETGFDLLDTLLSWCKTNGIYLILDMHCAPGGQNSGNISDSDGEAKLWTEPSNQEWAIEIWREIASRYSSEKAIAGFDLLNEPVMPSGYTNKDLRNFFTDAISEIREVDSNHMVFIEGNWYATDFADLTPPFDSNFVYSFHMYWTRPTLGNINSYINMRDLYGVPLWLGEFGENSNHWFSSIVNVMEESKIGWCWWTYKKVDTINGLVSVEKSDDYQALLNYWGGGASKPTVSQAVIGLNELTENLKFENVTLNEDVIHSLKYDRDPDQALPFTEINLPGTLPAVHYNLGNNGFAYKDEYYQRDSFEGEASWNMGWQYRNDGVDIEASTGDYDYPYNIGWTSDGEWLKYSVKVSKEGIYSPTVKISSTSGSSTLRLEVKEMGYSETISIPNTNGWQNWETANLPQLTLKAGTVDLKIEMVKKGFNINSIKFDYLSSIDDQVLIEGYFLANNYPNPFNSSTKIRYGLGEKNQVSLVIFNLIGMPIRALVDDKKDEGDYTVYWDGLDEFGKSVGNGVYFYKIITPNFSNTKKMLILK